MHRFVTLIALSALIASCGSPPPAKGSSSNSSSNSSTSNSNQLPPPNQRMEQGSPQFEVQSAFDRLYPLLCQYDATCDMPLIQQSCPLPAGSTPDGSTCWVVNAAQLTNCESALNGLQCQGTYENLPASCAQAVRQCDCREGYERSFTSDGDECLPVCERSNTCPSGYLCYDGVCSPEQDDWCADDYTYVFLDDEEQCHPSCEFGCEGDLVCDDIYNACLPEQEEDEPINAMSGG